MTSTTDLDGETGARIRVALADTDKPRQLRVWFAVDRARALAIVTEEAARDLETVWGEYLSVFDEQVARRRQMDRRVGGWVPHITVELVAGEAVTP